MKLLLLHYATVKHVLLRRGYPHLILLYRDTDMGCGGSKVEDFPAVVLCRERKAFLKAASEQRYALTTAHVAYFHSLSEIGDALHKFAEQDLTTTTGSSSPVLTLPSETKSINNNKLSSSSPSIASNEKKL